ncbi:MAG TPA: hypothetical protein VHO46_03605 [Bacteroidales bacterium]|jgi:nitrite reductase/ring-hydroxylating ferredoxin subunit|nr:hypothetical protein [Bacteroidales bacterium]
MNISKLKLFPVFCILYLLTGSCHKKNEVIPDVTVDFYLDINDVRFIDLNSIGGSVLINNSTNNDRYAAGFSGNGIIVTRGVDEFFAYDRTCPHDYALDGTITRIDLDPSGFAKAVCPVCKTAYELLSFGTPSSGVGNYQLKRYHTDFDGRYIRVWND